MKKGVYLIAATSLDNFISPLDKIQESSTNWTTKEDKKFFMNTTKQAGVVIYGSKTYETIPKKYRPLKDRLNIVITKDPSKYKDEIKKNKGKIVATSDSPSKIIKRLHRKGFATIAVCGGHQIYQLFLDANVVNMVYQTVESITFNDGIPFLKDSSYSKLLLNSTIDLSEKTKVKVFDVIK